MKDNDSVESIITYDGDPKKKDSDLELKKLIYNQIEEMNIFKDF